MALFHVYNFHNPLQRGEMCSLFSLTKMVYPDMRLEGKRKQRDHGGGNATLQMPVEMENFQLFFLFTFQPVIVPFFLHFHL